MGVSCVILLVGFLSKLSCSVFKSLSLLTVTTNRHNYIFKMINGMRIIRGFFKIIFKSSCALIKAKRVKTIKSCYSILKVISLSIEEQ